MPLLIKKRGQVSKNVNEWTVSSHGFEKCKVMTRIPGASSVAAKSEHIDQINSHYASNKHQRNAVSHHTMRQHGDLLNFDFPKSSDSSNRLFRFAFVNKGSFVNGGGCGQGLWEGSSRYCSGTRQLLRGPRIQTRNHCRISAECFKAVIAGLWPVWLFVVARGQK